MAAALESHEVRGQIKSSIRTDAGQTLKLRSEDVLNLLVPTASLEDQIAVVDRLRREGDYADALHARLDHQIALLQERRQALITAAVTGQLDIPGAS
ncbi:MAG: hypothetical protein L0H41_12365 [Microlunatus sp.]|nr:hypothetical protein [Microlunatus sp.]MDN5794038.1 hypothetical protein [Brevibacterium aurantiacum]